MGKIDSDKRKKLGIAIASARAKAGLTQTQLADVLGYTNPSYLSRIENGKQAPSLPTLFTIAEACDTRIMYFFVNL